MLVKKFENAIYFYFMGGCHYHIYKYQVPKVSFDLSMILTILKAHQIQIPENTKEIRIYLFIDLRY